MFNTARTVFLKESRDLLRDWGTLLALFAAPFIIVLLYLIIAIIIALYAVREVRQGLPVALINGDQLPELHAALEKSSLLKLVPPPADPEQALRNGELALVLAIPDDAAESLAAGRSITLTMTAGYAGMRAELAVASIQSLVEEYGDEVLAERLAKLGVDSAWLEPVRLQLTPLPAQGIAAAPVSGGGAHNYLASLIFLPYIMSLWAFGGGVDLMLHMTAGEKERRTIESLLTTPASRVGLVLGKVTLSVVVSIISSALWSLTTLPFVYISSATFTRISGLSALGPSRPANLWMSVVWLTLLMAPLMITINGFVAAIGGIARSMREANYITFIIRLLLPALAFMAVLAVGATPPLSLYFTPILGVMVAMRDLWGGGIAPAKLLLALLAATIYAVGTVLIAAYIFSREWAMRGA